MQNNSEILDLKKAVWRLEQVCQELKESRQNDLKDFSKYIADLHAETQRFMAHIDEYGKIGAKIGPTISHYIKEAAGILSESASQKLITDVEERVNASIQKLENTVYQTSQALDRSQIALTKTFAALISALCLGAILTSLTIVWFVPFKLKPYLTDDMMHTYGWGVIVKNVMPHLNKDEARQLKKLLRITK